MVDSKVYKFAVWKARGVLDPEPSNPQLLGIMGMWLKLRVAFYNLGLPVL